MAFFLRAWKFRDISQDDTTLLRLSGQPFSEVQISYSFLRLRCFMSLEDNSSIWPLDFLLISQPGDYPRRSRYSNVASLPKCADCKHASCLICKQVGVTVCTPRHYHPNMATCSWLGAQTLIARAVDELPDSWNAFWNTPADEIFHLFVPSCTVVSLWRGSLLGCSFLCR